VVLGGYIKKGVAGRSTTRETDGGPDQGAKALWRGEERLRGGGVALKDVDRQSGHLQRVQRRVKRDQLGKSYSGVITLHPSNRKTFRKRKKGRYGKRKSLNSGMIVLMIKKRRGAWEGEEPGVSGRKKRRGNPCVKHRWPKRPTFKSNVRATWCERTGERQKERTSGQERSKSWMDRSLTTRPEIQKVNGR